MKSCSVGISQSLYGSVWISTSAISALTNSVKGFSLKNSELKSPWSQTLRPITGSAQASQLLFLSEKNSTSSAGVFVINIGGLRKVILVVKLKGTSTVQCLISPQILGDPCLLQVLVANSIFFLIKPAINSIPVPNWPSWEKGIILDLKIHSF